MLHAVSVVTPFCTMGERAHLSVWILSLNTFVHLCELINTRMHLSLAVLQTPLIACNQVALVLEDRRQVRYFILILLVGVDVVLVLHELLLM